MTTAGNGPSIENYLNSQVLLGSELSKVNTQRSSKRSNAQLSPSTSFAKNRNFGGFSTAQQETYYLKMVDKTVKMIADRLSAVYTNNQFPYERKWAHSLRKSYKALHLMEKHKTTEPRFSHRLKQLQIILKAQFTSVSQGCPINFLLQAQ